MRIIGEIPHSIYKISILHMNNKHSLKIEDGLYEQVFSFRDGEPLNNLNTLKEQVSDTFLEEIAAIFEQMKKVKNQLSLQSSQNDSTEEFDDII